MAFEYNDQRKETGVDVTLEISPLDGEVPITNASYSEEAETSEVQFNDSYGQDIAITGVSYSGSFEVTGRNNDLRDALWSGDTQSGQNMTELPSYISTLTITDGDDRSYVFTNVLVTSHSKDAPADDRTTESYDFSAEKLFIEE